MNNCIPSLFLLGSILFSVTAAQADELPAPAMTRTEYIDYLERETTFGNVPEKITAMYAIDEPSKRVLLANLAHNPDIEEFEFDSVRLSADEIKLLNRLPKLKKLVISEYTGSNLVSLASIKQLESLEISRCSGIDWRKFVAEMQHLRSLRLYNTTLGADGLRILSGLNKLEAIQLSGYPALNDQYLKSLADFDSLSVVEIYSSRQVRGEFLGLLRGHDLRVFKFTGTMTPLAYEQLLTNKKLEELVLNVSPKPGAAWYAALAANCPNLRVLHLFRQSQDAEQIKAIAQLTKLTDLALLASGSLTKEDGLSVGYVPSTPGMFTPLSALSNLQTLRISGKYTLSPEDGAAICSLSKLEHLELRNARLKAGVFKNLGNLSKVRELGLHAARELGAEDCHEIGKLKNLESLDASNLNTFKADFSRLAGLNKLRELDFQNHIAMRDSDFAFAAGTPNLEKVTMSFNRLVTDKGLAQLGAATKLRELDIVQAGMTGKGFADWPADHALETLYIRGGYIQAKGLQAMSHLKNLRVISVRVLSFSSNDVDVTCFAKTPALERLWLEGYTTSQAGHDSLMKSKPDLNLLIGIKDAD